MNLRGSICPLVTPTTEGTEVDVPALRSFAHGLLDAGLDGLMPCGSTGEFPSMTRDQRRTVVETVVEISGEAPVIAGCGHTSIGAVEALIDDAADAGADAAVVGLPYYFPAGQDEFRRFFEAVADRSSLPVLLYNNAAYAEALTADSVLELAAHENVVGIKDSSGNLPLVHRVVRETPAEFAVLQGAEAQSMGALEAGVDALVPGMSNIFPTACAELAAAAEAGDDGVAVELSNDVLLPVITAVLSSDAPLAAIKHLTAVTGFDVGPPFPPSARLTADEKRTLRTRYEAIVDNHPLAGAGT